MGFLNIFEHYAIHKKLMNEESHICVSEHQIGNCIASMVQVLTPHACQQLSETSKEQSMAIHHVICPLFYPPGVESL